MTIGQAKLHQEIIDEEICRVIVAHKSKTVWIAYGNFRGTQLNVSGESESISLNNWIRRANNEANS